MSLQPWRKSSPKRSSTSTRNNTAPTVICLFGPTAVGKTDLLETLFGGRGEIISADSMQVYRHLDIGSAKPGPSYLKRIPHHLIDILDFREQFNAGDFVRRAEELVADIHSRGLLPVISGGTAFYFRNFIYGLPDIPPVSGEFREELNNQLEAMGPEALHRELAGVDPETAERLEPADRSRIVRALEVYRGTGKPLSSYKAGTESRKDLRYLLIGLERPRGELYGRIDKRVEIMFEKGLPDEVRKLIAMGATADDPGMKGIGYSEFFPFLKEGCLTMEGVKSRIQQDSRRYAKRQMTFFRSLPEVHWRHPDNIEGIEGLIARFSSAALDLRK